ncbi:MAG: serine hydrolase [Lachnospiraceae bacterium]|nr:serine hydrolase [Lachnospiraceae bacterium]
MRKITVHLIYLLIIAAGIALIVFLSSGIIKSIKEDDTEDVVPKKEAVYIEVTDIPGDRASDDTEKEEHDVVVDTLGSNDTADSDKVNVHGTDIFSGYDIKKTDSTYYITSENMMSTYAILVDATDGTVVCQKEGFTRINPASMTKIMTVLVAAEHLREADLDEKVTITVEDTDYAYVKKLSAVNFNIDEVVTVRDLFYGTILPSGADAASALARYVAGDEEGFVKMMNDKAEQLGISDTTHFTNCVGMYNEDHYSTCADMAVIIKAAIENTFIFDVMNAHTYTTSLTPEHPEGIMISNWFLRRIEDKDTNGEVLCAKTGFVNESGSCAASYEVTNNGHPYICVTADAHSAWRCIYDHVDLYANCTQ